ncbi:uncharacterized protein [Panulirus ornatus]|uniref:uncharacterized protein n=1 Tax=Panulirus ornatus TaxID=150431 RepID=UPI003A83FF6E
MPSSLFPQAPVAESSEARAKFRLGQAPKAMTTVRQWERNQQMDQLAVNVLRMRHQGLRRQHDIQRFRHEYELQLLLTNALTNGFDENTGAIAQRRETRTPSSPTMNHTAHLRNHPQRGDGHYNH